jgi:hypothetical protein
VSPFRDGSGLGVGKYEDHVEFQRSAALMPTFQKLALLMYEHKIVSGRNKHIDLVSMNLLYPQFDLSCCAVPALPFALVPDRALNLVGYFGLMHLPMQIQLAGWHPPPPCIAKLRKEKSCHELCARCKDMGCLQCPHCCVHKEHEDRGARFVYLFQERNTLKSRMAYFTIDDHAFPIKLGMTVFFNAALTPHGIWCASNPSQLANHEMFVEAAFVMK